MLICCEVHLIQCTRHSPEECFSSLLVHLPLNLTEKEKQSLAQPEISKNQPPATKQLVSFRCEQHRAAAAPGLGSGPARGPAEKQQRAAVGLRHAPAEASAAEQRESKDKRAAHSTRRATVPGLEAAASPVVWAEAENKTRGKKEKRKDELCERAGITSCSLARATTKSRVPA